MATAENDLTTRIAGAVKAELARRDLSGADLIEPLQMGKNAIYARLKGDQPFDVAELEQIVRFLGITLDDLWSSAAIGMVAA